MGETQCHYRERLSVLIYLRLRREPRAHNTCEINRRRRRRHRFHCQHNVREAQVFRLAHTQFGVNESVNRRDSRRRISQKRLRRRIRTPARLLRFRSSWWEGGIFRCVGIAIDRGRSISRSDSTRIKGIIYLVVWGGAILYYK